MELKNQNTPKGFRCLCFRFQETKVRFGYIRQSSGLSTFISFVPCGCYSRSFLPPFHSTLISQQACRRKKRQHACSYIRPHLHTVIHFVRRGLCASVQAIIRFATLHYCLPVLAHRPLLIWRLRLRRSVTPNRYALSGCFVYFRLLQQHHASRFY